MSILQSLPAKVKDLPIAEVVPQVCSALASGNVLLHAEPGAGKSTGLPLALIAEASTDKRIILLEPRRLAALGVAERLASQLGEKPGARIGLRMRGITRVSKETLLEVVTEGVLTRILQSDPTLEGIGLVIFDEFHERSMQADLGLALCLEVQQAVRDDLRLLLMSATLDEQQLSDQLADAKQVYCAGRQYPVDIKWSGQSRDPLPQQVSLAVVDALREESGDVLVFLPGVFEIDRTARLLQSRLADDVIVFQLHGGADSATQRAATAAASKTQRRVILSTSIAETSLTIDGVRVVIDAGLERRGRIDSTTGAVRLETVTASQASATQRSGRAGRTAAGVCYRLWSENDHVRRTPSWQPEILRSDLSSLLLELGKWGVANPDDLPWLEAPPEAAIARAQTLLESLGIWHNGRLTDHGKQVADLPVHPRLGHMLLWSMGQGCYALACKLAVLLEDNTAGNREIDLDSLLQRTPSRQQQNRINQLAKQLPGKTPALIDAAGTPGTAVLLAQAYPDWIAKRRAGREANYLLACGAGAQMSLDKPLAHDEYLAVARMGGADKQARIFLACSLNIDELELFSPELFSSRDNLGWDDNQERVIAERQKMLGNLVVQSRTKTDISNADKARALLEGVRQRGLNCLPWTDECREWQARVNLIRNLPKQGKDLEWPPVDDVALLGNLEGWLLVWLEGKGSLKSLAQLDLKTILASMLDYSQQQQLDALLPRKYRVPSGSQIALRYVGTEQPVLSVKLQEMFGCKDNPAIANGQVPLKVELLSPARRPVQITTDLGNFWSNSYPDVRKDMAGRYPKHDWPDDPLQAIPTAYAKRRKNK